MLIVLVLITIILIYEVMEPEKQRDEDFFLSYAPFFASSAKEGAQQGHNFSNIIGDIKTEPPTVGEVFDRLYDELRTGNLLFNPPSRMREGEPYRIEARIARDLSVALDQHLQGKGIPFIENIKVSREMKVTLTGDHFDIVDHNESEQFVPKREFAQWSWEVTPRESGKLYLFLRVSLTLMTEAGEMKRDFPVKYKKVQVTVNPWYSITQFVGTQYPWLLGVVLTGMGLWISFKSLKKK